MPVSLADEAYLAIRDEILRGQLGPGTPLSRRRLATQLGMSVLPVSDALKRLEEDGLVETRARAGTRVKVPTRTRRARALRAARSARDPGRAAFRRARHGRASTRAAPPGRGMSTRSSSGWQTAAKTTSSGSPSTASTCSSTCSIAEHANSQLLKQMIERKHVLILNWIFDITGRRTPLPPGFHSRLAEGLISGEPGKADALMREHVRHGFGEISTHIGAPRRLRMARAPHARQAGAKTPAAS